MIDEEREERADQETLPDTPLHAYRDGREEDVEGDVDKLKSGDQFESQRDEIEEEADDSGEHVEPPPKD
jgi:hypothetical protein